MTIQRIHPVPTFEPHRIQDQYLREYMSRLIDNIQQERGLRVKDFDILRLNNVVWIDARRYGVVGDDSADDTIRLQAAITAVPTNGVLLIPNGTYLASNLTSVSNMRIVGENKEGTIIKHAANATDHMIEGAGNLELCNLTLDGNKVNQVGRYGGLYFDGSKVLVENCIIKNTVSAGLYIQGATEVDAIHNRFSDITEHGGVAGQTAFGIYMPAALSGSAYVHIHGNRFINSVPTGGNDRAPGGIFLSGSEAVGGFIEAIITDNYFDYFGGAFAANPAGCIDLYKQADRTIITGNKFKNFHFTPIKCSDSGELIISNNILENPGYDFASASITVQGIIQNTVDKHDVIVSNNIINNQYGTGVSVSVLAGHTTKRRIIQGNIIKACTRGVSLSAVADSAIIEGNIIDATYCTVDAIRVLDSSGEISISGNTIKNLLAGCGIFARTGVTGVNFNINNNSIQSDGTADYHVTVQDANRVICNGNTFIGDDPPVDFDNIVELTLIGNQSENLSPSFGAGLTTKINYGNSWDCLTTSATWTNPGAIANGAEVEKTVTVTGAALGGYASASLSCDVLDLQLTAVVSAINTVSVSLGNLTGGNVTLNSGNDFTVYVKVEKR